MKIYSPTVIILQVEKSFYQCDRLTPVSVTVSIVACSSKCKEKQHGFFVIFGINTGLSRYKIFQIDTLRFVARDFLLKLEISLTINKFL